MTVIYPDRVCKSCSIYHVFIASKRVHISVIKLGAAGCISIPPHFRRRLSLTTENAARLPLSH